MSLAWPDHAAPRNPELTEEVQAITVLLAGWVVARPSERLRVVACQCPADQAAVSVTDWRNTDPGYQRDLPATELALTPKATASACRSAVQ